jgi:hypothetical protein
MMALPPLVGDPGSPRQACRAYCRDLEQQAANNKACCTPPKSARTYVASLNFGFLPSSADRPIYIIHFFFLLLHREYRIET